MASVRITSKVKSAIQNKGNTLFHNRIDKKVKSLRPDFYDDIAQRFMDEFIIPYQRNRSFPTVWMQECLRVTVDFKTGTEYFNTLNKSHTLLKISNYVDSSTLLIPEKCIDPDLAIEFNIYFEEIKLLKEERDLFSKELNRVLNNCNTITQFLKVWPQGEHLIEGLDFNTPTRTRKKREIEVDESTLNTLNVGLLKQTMLNK